MNQKQLIIEALKANDVMTQSDLSEALYDDRNHLSNLYSSLMGLVTSGIVIRYSSRPSYYSLNGKEINFSLKNKINDSSFNLQDIPAPSIEVVEYWLGEWDKLEDYVAQEKAIETLFNGEFKSNSNINNILIKCSVLNDFYSTNIFKIYPVAKHILKLDIDESLAKGDTSLVNKISEIHYSKTNVKHYYSFASKFCSHHQPLLFPIYDSYVHKMLVFFKKRDKFYSFNETDLKNYSKFKNILIEFQKFYNLEQYNLKELDKYLWQCGKYFFPNKY